jgi:outer membrane protein assembly factor BamB
MSGFGLVTCMDAPTGRILWQVDTVQVFGAENTTWNISESLLVVDGWVICTPGGSTALLAALDLETGETVWATPGTGAKSAYCSPLLVETGGNRVIVTMVETGLVGVDLRNGDLLWHVPHKNRHAVHAPTPVYADGLIAFSSGYGEGTVALRLSDDGRQVRPLWQSKDLDNHHGGIILHQGALYGTNNRELVCMDLRTGKVNWTERRVGKGALSMADGMLYAYNEKGVVSLARVSPQAGEVVSSFRVTEGSGQHWAHPVIDNGRLYIRHGDTLLVFDVAGGA